MKALIVVAALLLGGCVGTPGHYSIATEYVHVYPGYAHYYTPYPYYRTEFVIYSKAHKYNRRHKRH